MTNSTQQARAAVTREAIEAAARAMFPDNVGPAYNLALRALEAAAPYMLAKATKLIRDLSDPDPCQFDHHGGCQAHGYLSLEPGETCPQQDAKEWERAHG